MSKTRVAFLGLGRMGIGMAGRLVDAGFDVAVYNRTAVRADPLVERGARLAESPRDAAAGAEAVVSMVADDDASRAVWLGDDGALAALDPGAFVIECSTLSHGWVLELRGHAADRDLRYIDSPVTGLADVAAAGALTLLVGAAADDLAAADVYLVPLCERIFHFGPIGAGTAYKLMINLMGAVQIAAAAEGMTIAEKAGLDLDAVADAIAVGQAASPQVVRNTRKMADARHDTDITFTPPLRLKDASYGVRMARDLGLSAPFGSTACETFRRLCEMGYETEDESVVIQAARKDTT